MKKLSDKMIEVIEEQQAIKNEIQNRNPDASATALAVMTATAMRTIYEMGEDVFA